MFMTYTPTSTLRCCSHMNKVDIEPNQCITSSEVTYAVVDKSKKWKCEEMKSDEDSNENDCSPVSACNPEANKKEEAIDEMYAVVSKIMRKSQVSEEEKALPIPPHTVDELYAAVNKIPNNSVAGEAPPIPLESLYTTVKKAPIADHQEDQNCKP